MGTVYLPGYAAPLASDFTITQTTGAGMTLTDTDNGLQVTMPAQAGSGTSLALHSVSSSSAFSVIASVKFAMLQNTGGEIGICVYNSGTGKFSSIVLGAGNGPYVYAVQLWNSLTSVNTTAVASAMFPAEGCYFKIDYNGSSTITFSLGASPDDFVPVYSESKSSFIGDFDKAGLMMYSSSDREIAGAVTWYQDTSLSPRTIQISTP